MSLPQFQFDGIRALIQRLAGPSVIVVWDNDPQMWDGASGLDNNGVAIPGATLPFATVAGAGLPARIDLSLVNVVSVGTDERIRTYVPESSPGAGDDKQTVTISGIRHTTLSIKVFGYLFPSSADIVERIRTSLVWPSSLKTFRSLGMAVRKMDIARVIPVPDSDGRQVDCMALDVFLALNSVVLDEIGESDVDPAYPRTKDNFITSVGITGLGVTSTTPGASAQMRWGVSTQASGYDASFVLALAGMSSGLEPNPTFDAGTSKYCFIWIPDAYLVAFTWGNHTVDLDLVATLTVQGVVGKLYRTNIGLGALTLGVAQQ